MNDRIKSAAHRTVAVLRSIVRAFAKLSARQQAEVILGIAILFVFTFVFWQFQNPDISDVPDPGFVDGNTGLRNLEKAEHDRRVDEALKLLRPIKEAK